MTGLTYSSYKTQIATLAVVDENDSNFEIILPQAITYAELRICRDLDLMVTSQALTGTSYVLSVGNRQLSFPMEVEGGTIVVSEQINLLLPVGNTDPDFSERVALTPTTKEFLDAVYGSSLPQNRAQPQYYAPFNENLYLVGPVPDQAYGVEVVCTIRPTSLSAGNPETFISTYLPDLFIMASMIYVSGYQRNFGRQADDPQMAVSYEQQYQTLLRSASVEEARKKYEGPGWSSQSPAPTATPTRG